MRKKLVQRWGVISLLLLVSLGLTACGSDDDDEADAAAPSSTTEAAREDDGSAEWQEVVDAAKAEGQVVLYHAKSDENAKAILDAFEAKYGIKGTAFRAPGGPMTQRIEQELAAGSLGGDLVLFGDAVYPRGFAEKGELLEATGPAAEAYAEEDLGDGVVVMGRTPLAIIYNTDAISTPPTDWPDMLDDSLTVGLTDPAASKNWAALYSLIADAQGDDYLTELGKQDAKVDQTSVVLVQSIASGEIDWTPFGFSYNLNQFEGTGAPIALAYPKSATYVFTQVGFVHAKAAHPNAGRLLQDFLMSEEGQAILNGNNEGISPLDGVEGTVVVPDDVKIVPIDLSKFSDEDIAAITKTWNGLFAG